MSHELNLINSFQFNNLIQNRVPFLIVSLEVDLVPHYKGLDRMHIESHSIQTTEKLAIETIKSKNLDPSQALVIICKNGSESSQIASQLEQTGFINVYAVRDGFDGLLNAQDS